MTVFLEVIQRYERCALAILRGATVALFVVTGGVMIAAYCAAYARWWPCAWERHPHLRAACR